MSRLRTLAGVQLPRPAATPVELPGAVAPAPPARPHGRRRRRILVAASLVLVVLAAGATAIVLSSFGHKGHGADVPEASPDYPYAPPGIVVSPDGQWLYVTLNFRQLDSEGWKWRGALVAVDAQERSVGTVIKLNDVPQDIVISPDGKRLYVVAGLIGGYGEVVSIDTGTGTVLNRLIAVGADPRSIAISRDGTRLYVANHGSDTVSAIDTGTGSVVRQFRPGCGTKPVSVAVGRDANRVYVICETSNVVAAMDGATGTTIGTPVQVGRRPANMALSPDGTRLYVTTVEPTTIDVAALDTATNALAVKPFPAATWYRS